MRPGLFRRDHARHDDMADDQHRNIGRRIVGALVMQVLGADRAGVDDFQISAKQAPLAAIRATLHQSAPHREPEVAPAGAVGCDGLRHDLVPFFRPTLLFTSRLALPEMSRALFLRALFVTPPSESISKRSAPAKGAASTSFTSTLSPRRKVSPVRAPTSAREVSSKRK